MWPLWQNITVTDNVNKHAKIYHENFNENKIKVTKEKKSGLKLLVNPAKVRIYALYFPI